MAALKPFDAAGIYNETVKALEAAIIAEYGSVLSFCKKNKLGYHNLNKIFSDNVIHEMSVGVYFRICAGLGLMDPANIAADVYSYRISLKDYLTINNNLVMTSILTISRL